MKTTRRILVAASILMAIGCGGSSQKPQSQISLVRAAALANQDQCLADADCGSGAACKQFCGNGWCGNVCIQKADPAPATSDCQSDSDCGATQACQTFCGNGWCDAVCVDQSPTPAPDTQCQTDADCGAAEVCTQYCGNGWCASACTPKQCQADADCVVGNTCQSGKCAPTQPQECASDASCAANEVCQTLCGNGWCRSTCIAKTTPNPVDKCAQGCAIGCPAPPYWVCGASGQRYCNSCIAGCYKDAVVTCPSPTIPVASAGPDQTVVSGDTVALDGTGSYSPAGGNLSYAWTQTAGPTVVVTNASSATASFQAPAVTAATTLSFSLTISAAGQASLPDSVTVTVNPASNDVDKCIQACGIGCPAPQYWVCGMSGERYCTSCVAACYHDPVVTCP